MKKPKTKRQIAYETVRMNKGESASTHAKQFGLSEKTVRRWRKRQDPFAPRQGRTPKYTNAQIIAIIRAFKRQKPNEKVKTRELAEKLKCSRQHAYNLLRKFGITSVFP